MLLAGIQCLSFDQRHWMPASAGMTQTFRTTVSQGRTNILDSIAAIQSGAGTIVGRKKRKGREWGRIAG